MCDPVTIAVAAGTALVGKKMADDSAKKKEDAFKKQQAEANRLAAEEQKKLQDQLKENEKNPLLVGKGGQYKSGSDSLRVKKATTSPNTSIGTGGSTGTGLNI